MSGIFFSCSNANGNELVVLETDPVLLQLQVEGLAVDAQELARLRLVAVRFLEHPEDVVLLHLLEGRVGAELRDDGRGREGEVFRSKLVRNPVGSNPVGSDLLL